ncbi:MAG TPA: methyltransferase [Polyangiaceae bacterium]|nr:methyltransferase [Polyangiaceae bacterium]
MHVGKTASSRGAQGEESSAFEPALVRRPIPPPSPLDQPFTKERLPGMPPGLVLTAALKLRRWVLELTDAIVPIEVALIERMMGMMFTVTLAAMARYGVADMLKSGPLTAEEIAARAGTDPDATHRALRWLASRGVFELKPDGRFENNRLSKGLMSGRRMRGREAAQYFGSLSNIAAWCDLERTLETGKNAFERVLGTSVWAWFDRHPDERENFAHAMMGITVATAPLVAELFPFAEAKVVCDIGGGMGTLLSELLVRHPHLRGILADNAEVCAKARELLAARGVADRVEIAPASFFESVPLGADTYILKNVLHDWDDERSRAILRNVRRAVPEGGRVLIAEMLVERNETAGVGPMIDLQMMMVCSDGRERGRSDFQRLLRDAGFAPGRVLAHPAIAVIEGLPA